VWFYSIGNNFHTQPGWWYWHVPFPVFLLVTSGFCLLFGWMLFLAESLSRLWDNILLVKIHSSIYIINSLLAANCMYIWVSTFSTIEKTNGYLANQRKHNFYKRWRHELGPRGLHCKNCLGPPYPLIRLWCQYKQIR